MNSNIFKVIFSKLVAWHLPGLLRTDFWLNWFFELIKPLRELYQEFLVFRNNTKYWMGITPQVCYLEKALNDTFDTELRRIYIADTEIKLVTLIHKNEANKP